MCDPVTLTVVAVGLAAASGGMQAYGKYEEGKAQDKYYQSMADQNEEQAKLGEENAKKQTTLYQNEAAQRTKELKSEERSVIGAQKAAMAAAGNFGSVTSADLLGDTINKSGLDEANIRYNADVNSWMVKKQAVDQSWALKNQASLFRYSGKQAKKAAAIATTASILGTAGSVAGMGAMAAGGGGGTMIQGGKGGTTTNTAQFGKVWSPYKAG